MSEGISIAKKHGVEVLNCSGKSTDSLSVELEKLGNKLGIKTNKFGINKYNAMVTAVPTDSYQFNLGNEKVYSTIALKIKATEDLALVVNSLFKKNYEIKALPTYDLKKCDVIAKWRGEKDFIFEMNAQIILEIFLREKFSFNDFQSFYIPVIFFSGEESTNHFIEVSESQYKSMKKLTDTVKKYWNPNLLPESTRKKSLGAYKRLKKLGIYPMYGCLVGNYLRPWTYDDINAI